MQTFPDYLNKYDQLHACRFSCTKLVGHTYKIISVTVKGTVALQLD